MRLRLSPIVSITIKYLWQRYGEGSPLWFKRRVPKELQGVLGSQWIQQSLGTSDPKVASRLIDQLVREQDKEWSALRAEGSRGVEAQARAWLSQNGINPDRPSEARGDRGTLHDHLDDHIPDHIREDPYRSDEEKLGHLHLSVAPHSPRDPAREGQHKASDCQREYAARADTPQALKSATLPFEYLIKICGDKPLGDYRRKDVRDYVAHLAHGKHSATGKGIATSTIDRYIRSLSRPLSLGPYVSMSYGLTMYGLVRSTTQGSQKGTEEGILHGRCVFHAKRTAIPRQSES